MDMANYKKIYPILSDYTIKDAIASSKSRDEAEKKLNWISGLVCRYDEKRAGQVLQAIFPSVSRDYIAKSLPEADDFGRYIKNLSRLELLSQEGLFCVDIGPTVDWMEKRHPEVSLNYGRDYLNCLVSSWYYSPYSFEALERQLDFLDRNIQKRKELAN